MVEIIVFSFIGLLAILGLVESIRHFRKRILNPKYRCFVAAVLPVKGEMEDIEYQLRALVSDLTWNSYACQPMIALVDYGVYGQTQEIIEKFCSSEPYMYVVKPDELGVLIADTIGLQSR